MNIKRYSVAKTDASIMINIITYFLVTLLLCNPTHAESTGITGEVYEITDSECGTIKVAVDGIGIYPETYVDGVEAISVRCSIENVNACSKGSDTIYARDLAENYVSLLDMEGFSCEFYDLSTSIPDGVYTIDPDIKLSEKRRAGLLFWIAPGTENLTVKVGEKTIDFVKSGSDYDAVPLSEGKTRNEIPTDMGSSESTNHDGMIKETNLYEVEKKESDKWVCPTCGDENTENFCGSCGTERPEPEQQSQVGIIESDKWVCPTCGDENTWNFCGSCGTERPEPEQQSSVVSDSGIEANLDESQESIQHDHMNEKDAIIEDTDTGIDTQENEKVNTNEIDSVKQVREAFNKASDYLNGKYKEAERIKQIKSDSGYANTLVRLGRLKEAIDNGKTISDLKGWSTSLFGKEASSIDELEQWRTNMSSYLVEEGDPLEALFSKMKMLTAVNGVVETTQVDIAVDNMDNFLEELVISPEIFGKIWAITDVYGATTEFTDTGFNFKWIATDDYSQQNSEEKRSEEALTPTDVEKAYITATTITRDRMKKDSYGGWSYEGVEFVTEDCDWLNNPINKEGTINQGAFYRKMAYLLEGSELGFGYDKAAKWILGQVPKSKEEWESHYTDLSSYIVTKDCLNAIMRRFSTLNSINGTFDFDNKVYQYYIEDVRECAKELNITEQMLGWILAELDEYGVEAYFDGNAYISGYNGVKLSELIQGDSTGDERTETSHTDAETIKIVQEQLNAAGYECGTADGIVGSKTTAAIEQFKSDHSFTEVNADITDELLDTLLNKEESKTEDKHNHLEGSVLQQAQLFIDDLKPIYESSSGNTISYVGPRENEETVTVAIINDYYNYVLSFSADETLGYLVIEVMFKSWTTDSYDLINSMLRVVDQGEPDDNIAVIARTQKGETVNRNGIRYTCVTNNSDDYQYFTIKILHD